MFKLNQVLQIAVLFTQAAIGKLIPSRIDVREVTVDKLVDVGSAKYYRIRFKPSIKNPDGWTQLVNEDFLVHYSELAKSIQAK